MEKAYDKALKLIKIRPHHSSELARKLLLRGFNREVITNIISRLLSERLLDDEQFAQIYLDNLIKYKTFGFYGLKTKLMQRGVPANEAEALLKKNLSHELEKEIALKLEGKSEGDKIKFAQKLQRKGFRTEVIRSFLQVV